MQHSLESIRDQDINMKLTFKTELLKQGNTTRLHKFTNNSVGLAQIAFKNSNFASYCILVN